MAAVRLLTIGTTGLPTEHTTTGDITFGSLQIASGGPLLNLTGLDMNSTTISDVGHLSFSAPATQGLGQTAGTLAADNIMAKERDNVMSTTGAILFGVVTDTAGLVDSLKIPHIAGTPTATPSFSTDAGYLLFDDTNNLLYAWDGAAWNSAIVTATSVPKTINMLTFTAAVSVTANDVVYISGESLISPADASNEATARAIGFATSALSTAGAASIQYNGVLAGFSGLVGGSRYFLAETPGGITTTVNSSAPSSVVQCGYAANSTTMNIMFQYLGIRNA